MRRRVLAVLLAGALLPAGLAGCGIPDQTEVQVDGAGPAAERGSLNGGGAQPPTPADSNEPAPFIENYLAAAAAGEREQAYTRAKEFIADDAKDDLREKRQNSEIELTVVRLRERPEVTPPNNDRTSTVTIKVQQVGVLRADGTLGPAAASETEYVFRLRPVAQNRPELRIYELPNVLLASDDALWRYYGAHTIYFWNSDLTRLVPDQRYLPAAVPAERRVTEVVKWLTGGPSDWLARAVSKLPDNTTPINNATGSDGRWEINLNMPGATESNLAQLATQLAWSLPELTGQLDLKIQNQKRLTVDLKQERAAHPAYPVGGKPERFGVYDGAIHPLNVVGETSGPVPVAAAKNRNVVSASLNRSAGDKVLAALVVTRSDRKQVLRVGSGPGPVTVFNDSTEAYGAIGRPTWLRSLDSDNPAGLVVADGRLYLFDGAAGMRPVPLTISGKVTAVAGSLEGHRIALVVNGALYVAAVSVDGSQVGVGQPRRLVTRLSRPTAVDWIGENQLVFAGYEGNRPAIYQTTVDGALGTKLEEDIGAEVTQLAAYPGPVGGGLPAISYMYEANRAAYKNNPVENIKREQVKDVPTPPAGNRTANPTAPFFYY
ncbi:LpqB family beta-propeller domain-containing protein [Micromonospora sp. NPDC048930]|uniref:LpqB family beta-propeller domain-containing protein n=1 Tax=Micromonospora sp. NPDC048930 TaxID=3364261 RepID=UPI0037249D90